jgi:hypothetical protein
VVIIKFLPDGKVEITYQVDSKKVGGVKHFDRVPARLRFFLEKFPNLESSSGEDGQTQGSTERDSNGVSGKDKERFMQLVKDEDLTSSEAGKIFLRWASSELKEYEENPSADEFADLATLCLLYWEFGPEEFSNEIAHIIEMIFGNADLPDVVNAIKLKSKKEPDRDGYKIALKVAPRAFDSIQEFLLDTD